MEVASVGKNGDADGASFSPCLGTDGQFVAFTSSGTNLVDGDSNQELDVFLRDRGVPDIP